MKSRTIAIFVSVIMTGFTLFSCKNGNQRIIDTISFDSIQVNQTVHLTGDTAAPGANLVIDCIYPVGAKSQTLVDSINRALIYECFGDTYTRLSVKEAADSFRTAYMRDYLADVEPLYKEEKEKDPTKDESPWFSYYCSIEARPVNINPQIAIYRIDINEYTGGAHGMHGLSYLNFDPQNGHLLTLEELFKPGFEKPLDDLLLEQLMKDTHSNSLDELNAKAYLQWTDMYPSGNFIRRPEGITFVYNAYEIAPYSMGIIEITLSDEQMKNLLKDKK